MEKRPMEEIRICTFFDAIGTRGIMNGDESEKRKYMIGFVRRMYGNTNKYGLLTKCFIHRWIETILTNPR